MKSAFAAFLAGILLAGTALPAHAGGLLGLDQILTVESGTASGGGLVNLGLGGGNGNLVDLNLGGGSSPEATANVSLGGNDRLLGVDANVLHDTVNASVDVGRGNKLIDVDAGLLNNTITANVGVGGGRLVDIDVGVGNPGAPGQPGQPGQPGRPGTPGQPGQPGAIIAVGGGGGGVPACSDGSANQVVRAIRNTKLDASWLRASGVKIQRMEMCPEVKMWLAAQLKGSGLGSALRNAIQSDALVSASLSRTSYGPDRVFAVTQSGGQLHVFVY